MLLIEGVIQSRGDWTNQLTCTTEEFDRLLDRGVFERTRDGAWRLRFVGSLVMVNKLWFCIPKIAANESNPGEMQLGRLEKVLQVLEVYSDRSKKRVAGQDQLAFKFNVSDAATSPLRELEILAALVEWTTSYGFHATEVELLSSGFVHPTHWAKTYASDLPLHTHSGVIYGAPICVDTIRKQSPITLMQAQVLINLVKKYNTVTRQLIANSNDVILEANEILDHCLSFAYLSLSQLQEFFDATNRDHEKDLISLLISYVKINESSREEQHSIKLYGTTAFELVWEDMCRHIFVRDSFKYSDLSNPQYNINISDGPVSISSQRPDIIYQAENTVIIFDAKYYVDFPHSPPALEDVRKQFFYALSLPDGVRSISGFLFPRTSAGHVEYLGHVTMRQPEASTGELVEDCRFSRIHCIGMPWTSMVDSYLTRSSSNFFGAMILIEIRHFFEHERSVS
jgi:hypothetical protein